MKKKLIIYLIVGVVSIGFLISLQTWNDYSVKDLDEVIGYIPNDFTSLTLREKNDRFELKTDDNEAIEELSSFMKSYRIKKVSDRAYDDNLTNDEGFEIAINHTQADRIKALIHKDEVHIYRKGYYQVINGPIDMSWVRKFNEKYQH
ncbi:hypothetical protein [Oceanobacillus sp. CAU 1775]